MGLSKRELMKEKSAAAFHHKNSFINKLYDLIEVKSSSFTSVFSQKYNRATENRK